MDVRRRLDRTCLAALFVSISSESDGRFCLFLFRSWIISYSDCDGH